MLDLGPPNVTLTILSSFTLVVLFFTSFFLTLPLSSSIYLNFLCWPVFKSGNRIVNGIQNNEKFSIVFVPSWGGMGVCIVPILLGTRPTSSRRLTNPTIGESESALLLVFEENNLKGFTMEAHSVVPDVVDVLPEQVIKVSSSSARYLQQLIECRKIKV